MSSKAINGVKYWGQLLGLPVYWLSFCVLKRKDIWLFGSTFGRRFADNPRYLYLYVNQHKEEIIADEKSGRKVRPIWISHKKDIVEFLNRNGYEAYYYHSLKGIWYCLRGKIYIFDNYSKDISFWLSGGAVKFNLWHGIPLKKIQADNKFDVFRHPKNKWEEFKAMPRRMSDEKASHYVLTTSKFMKPIFESAFRTKHVMTSGYPRVDSFAGKEIENLYMSLEAQLLDKIDNYKKKHSGCKMIYYMPTFRESEKGFFQVIQLERFQKFLKEKNILLCLKLHPKSKLREEFARLGSENILNIDADTDPYVFIPVSDALVTDYSSIYFDYLFADRPVVFFDYDLDTYLSDSREMYFDYEEYTPGRKAATQEELEAAFLDITEGRDAYREARTVLKQKMFDHVDGHASRRIVKNVNKMINRGGR